MKPSEIITTVIAVYGAVLSTIAILRQFFTDKVKVKMTVSRNMQIVGDLPLAPLFVQNRALASFAFNSLQTLFANTGGWG
jgi:hypothetical protein